MAATSWENIDKQSIFFRKKTWKTWWPYHESWRAFQETWPTCRPHGMMMTIFRHDHGMIMTIFRHVHSMIMAWQPCISNPAKVCCIFHFSNFWWHPRWFELVVRITRKLQVKNVLSFHTKIIIWFLRSPLKLAIDVWRITTSLMKNILRYNVCGRQCCSIHPRLFWNSWIICHESSMRFWKAWKNNGMILGMVIHGSWINHGWRSEGVKVGSN